MAIQYSDFFIQDDINETKSKDVNLVAPDCGCATIPLRCG